MFREMRVAGLTVDPFTNMPIIILKDMEDKSALPIWIGLLEASAIATELEKVHLPRPMTHDLLKKILDSFKVDVIKIEVNDLKDNTFYATLHLKMGGKTHAIDSRPSDAIAIALRTDSPIYVSEEVIKKSKRIDLKEATAGKKDKESEQWAEILENMSPEAFGKYKM
ncbi:MAG: bifunctional nuclease family protein [Pseudomonadota bacterium]